MPDTTNLAEKLPEILEIARFAPSVHNTQPWSVSASGVMIEVALDSRHVLADGDPTGRETTISLGIFCEALRLAAGQCGLVVTAMDLQDNGARLRVEPGPVPPTAATSAELLKSRATDRSIYEPAVIDHQTIADIQGVDKSDGVTVRVLTEPDAIRLIAKLTGRGIGVALSNPSFRKELSRYLVLPWSGKKRGIAVMSLYIPWLVAVLQPLMLRLGLGTGKEAKTEERRWRSASGIALILADGDMPRHWFAAGRAYLNASLAIEAHGLSQATSAAVVEASNYHEDIEEYLRTNQRVLALIRIGKGVDERRYSPRLSAEDLLH